MMQLDLAQQVDALIDLSKLSWSCLLRTSSKKCWPAFVFHLSQQTWSHWKLFSGYSAGSLAVVYRFRPCAHSLLLYGTVESI